MKPLLSFGALVLMASLVGCSNNSGQNDTTSTNSTGMYNTNPPDSGMNASNPGSMYNTNSPMSTNLSGAETIKDTNIQNNNLNGSMPAPSDTSGLTNSAAGNQPGAETIKSTNIPNGNMTSNTNQ